MFCAACDETTVDRVELVVRPLLLSSVSHPPSATDDTLFGQTCDVVKRRRPDFLWLGNDRCVLVEIDENGGHGTSNYTPSCDLGWVMDMVVVLNRLYADGGWNEGRIPYAHIFRMNPDEYDGGSVTLDARIEALSGRIHDVLNMDVDPDLSLVPTVEYMYYHSKCRAHIAFAMNHRDAIRVL